MGVLLMRLEGPQQSWGTYSRFTERDSGRDPSKSGVMGILCAALGRPREAPLADLAAMKMAVRVDREGVVSKDFHTALDVPRAGNPGSDTVISNRYYLADACFLVAMTGEDGLVEELKAALANPHWDLSLGRKSFVPSTPILLEAIPGNGDGQEVLHQYRWMGRYQDRKPTKLRAVVECGASEGDIRMDVPTSFARREFLPRYVRNVWIPMGDLKEA